MIIWYPVCQHGQGESIKALHEKGITGYAYTCVVFLEEVRISASIASIIAGAPAVVKSCERNSKAQICSTMTSTSMLKGSVKPFIYVAL